MRVERLLETAVYGPDLEALERFYVDLLGLEPVAKTPGRNVVLRCGAAALILFDPKASGTPGGPFPPHAGPGQGHIAFSVPLGDLAAWRERLAAAGVGIEQEITWPDGNRSVYFRDPAGNSVELAPPTLWNGLGYRCGVARPGDGRVITQRIAAVVAVLFGVATLIAGTWVLSGSDPGYEVFRPLLLFNTAMGAAYVAAGITIWRSLRRAWFGAGAIFLLNLLVLAGILLLYRRGGPVAAESLRAMSLRTVVWLVLFLVVARLARARAAA